MKQRITIDQLNELSEGQKNKLQGLWEPRRGDMFFNTQRNLVLLAEAVSNEGIESVGDLLSKKECLPLLSIGQMIELLDPYGSTIFTSKMWIAADPPIYEISVNGRQFYEANMCDCLWEAVKKIL